MSAVGAVVYREAKIRATNITFIFWDLLFPLLYMLVFGVGINEAMGTPPSLAGVSYNEFFLAGVLAMASFAIASNTSWSFFLDRDNGIFYEMLTYPMSRSEYLLGKVILNRADIADSMAGAGRADTVAIIAAATVANGDWNGGVVFLLCDFCAAHEAQRRVQRDYQRVLFCVHVCEFDVLSARAAAEVVSRGGTGKSDYLAD